MAGDIWVLAEQWRGSLSDLTFELLVLGRELATGLGGRPLRAVLLGHQAQGLAQGLGAADGVLVVDDPALAEPNPEACCRALAALVDARRPEAVLVPWSNTSADVLGLLAARAKLPLANFCRDVRVAEGALEARCVLYGGKMEVSVRLAGAPAVLGVLPGARAGAAARVAGAPPVETVTVAFPAEGHVRFESYVEPAAGDVDITQQDALVAVGRGIQTQDNLELAEELAAALGGAVGASRPVIDQGWLPLSRQIGKSGATVKPKLYVAAGISGAPEHVEGMKNAELIIAINTDPQAPIFAVSHYGIVGDALDVLPALTAAVRAKKG
ncbi:MAG: electron transfer flavoprotein subunit alpha/FixB family protein [Gemmatimonadales bacterium]|jgi:electron transfer flavoprotein alpha subunit